MTADPKPAARIVNHDVGRAKLRRERCCRVCGHVPSGHPLDKLNRMHVVPKGLRGDDVDDNIVPGCGSGTTGCHGLLTSRREDPQHPTGMTVSEACARMVERLTPTERAYAEGKMYRGWLEEYYPPRGEP